MNLYDGGLGGKNANFAAMDEVTPPMLLYLSLSLSLTNC